MWLIPLIYFIELKSGKITKRTGFTCRQEEILVIPLYCYHDIVLGIKTISWWIYRSRSLYLNNDNYLVTTLPPHLNGYTKNLLNNTILIIVWKYENEHLKFNIYVIRDYVKLLFAQFMAKPNIA